MLDSVAHVKESKNSPRIWGNVKLMEMLEEGLEGAILPKGGCCFSAYFLILKDRVLYI